MLLGEPIKKEVYLEWCGWRACNALCVTRDVPGARLVYFFKKPVFLKSQSLLCNFYVNFSLFLSKNHFLSKKTTLLRTQFFIKISLFFFIPI